MPTDLDKRLEEIARTAIERANDTLHDLRGYDVLEYAAIEHEFTTALREAYDLGRDSERERAAKTFAEILGIAQQMAKLAREKSYIIGMENFAEAAEYICDKAKAAAIRRGEE